MRIKVTHGMDDFSRDLTGMARAAPVEIGKAARKVAIDGNNRAKGYARATSGKHAKKYPGTFTVGPVNAFYGFGGGNITVEYGPAPRGQGLLAPILENGSRNNPAHMNLARSADVVAVVFGPTVLYAANKLFWGGR